ncbi:MAG: PEP-CTERM sorting domain-containing protein [Pirellulales bacterium]|nr:PEP-CTERM sorting domain-containing protein [Pirellulales bacterium]
MTKQLSLCCLAILPALSFATTNIQAGLIDSATSFSAATTWDGFGDDFSPEWEGETTTVTDWMYLNPGSGWITSGTLDGTVDVSDLGILATNYGRRKTGRWVESGGHWETHPTVRQLSAQSSNHALNSTWLHVDGHTYTADKNESDEPELARYASLLTQSGTLLANASAISYKNTAFGDDEFSADGRVSAVAILSNAAEEATASATGRCELEASYELDQETAFSLDIDIARLGEVEFSFTATDKATGEVAFSFAPAETGTQQQITMNGLLEAGQYKFSLDCLADASISSNGQLDPGGQAMFDISLDLEEEYIQVWIPEYVWVTGYSSSYFNGGGTVEVYDLGELATNYGTVVSDAAVPEPSMLCLLLLGAITCLATRRRGSSSPS